MKSPGYFAIIPAPVRYHPSLSANAKLLFGELSALCDREGFAWASNGYFAKLYNVRPEAVSRWVSELRDAALIRVEVVQEKGNERKIWLLGGFVPLAENRETSREKSQEPSCEKSQQNNTRENNTRNGGSAFALADEAEPKEGKELEEVRKAWNDLPKDFGKVVALSDDRKRALRARLKDPFWRENWRRALEMIPASSFLSGKVQKGRERPWRASFDWFLRPGSVAKVIEGQYADAPTTAEPDWRRHL